MSRPDPTQIHEAAATGRLTDLEEALSQGADPNTPGHCGKTPLMSAIESKSLEKMQLLIANGADPEITDDFNSTALGCAVGADYLEGVRYLLSLGVDRGYHPKHPLKPVEYTLPVTPLPKELQGILTEEEWQESVNETNESIQELGRNPKAEPIVKDVQSVPILELFLQAGDPLDLADEALKREYVGLPVQEAFTCSLADYQHNKVPRFGKRNPEPMDNPFWSDMIRMGVNAYEAKSYFEEEETFNGPVWCFDRFGDTITALPDGRFVQIGGEHEDSYDPDFNIYNDVVVHDGRGGFHIFGYPQQVFPPTDFHTATLAGDSIYVIGCLGYPDQRQQGATPVYRLLLDSWRIEKMTTTGSPPGWLSDHQAHYVEADNAIHLTGGQLHVLDNAGDAQLTPNENRHALDLSTLKWSKIE